MNIDSTVINWNNSKQDDGLDIVSMFADIMAELEYRASHYQPEPEWIIPMSRKGYEHYLWVTTAPANQVRYRLKRGHCAKHARRNHHGVMRRLNHGR